MPNTELFGRQAAMTVRPVTADMCTIVWQKDSNSDAAPTAGNIVTGATSISIQYQQQVIRRRTLATSSGHPVAVIYPTQPMGGIQISRLFANLSQSLNGVATGITSSTHALFDFPGWNICNGTAAITVSFDGESAYTGCTSKNPGYRMTGCTVTSYSISAEAEGLTVVDNVAIEFLQMSQFGT